MAHGGARLQLGEAAGTPVIGQRAHAGADCARSHQHDFPSRFALGRHLRDQLFHLGQVRLLAIVGEDARAQLHHQAAHVFEGLATHGELLAENQSSVEEREWNALHDGRRSDTHADNFEL